MYVNVCCVQDTTNETYVLQALPFLLKDFITEEVAEINKKLKENGLDYLPPVQDPSDSIQLVINYFNDWYNHLHQPIASTHDLEEIAEKTLLFQKVLKLMFPTKSGLPELCLVCVIVCKTHYQDKVLM